MVIEIKSEGDFDKHINNSEKLVSYTMYNDNRFIFAFLKKYFFK